MHEVVNLILASGNSGVSTVKACTRVAELVQAEVRLPLSLNANRKKYIHLSNPSTDMASRHVGNVWCFCYLCKTRKDA